MMLADRLEEVLGFANLNIVSKSKVQGHFDNEWDNLFYALLRIIASETAVGYDPTSDDPDGKTADVLDIRLERRVSDVMHQDIWLALDESVVITRGDDRVVLAEVHEIRNVHTVLTDFMHNRQNYFDTYLIVAASSEKAVGLLTILKMAIC